MPRRITEDWKHFRDIVSGKVREALKKFIKGKIVRARAKDGEISITIPEIEQPHLVYGNNDEGIGRGKGKKGDVLKKDPEKGDKAGNEHSEGIKITLDLEEVLKFMQEDLALPNLKPKENGTYDDVEIKYNNISLVGPESLRHNRKTFLQAIKRQISMGTLDELSYVPGCKDPIRIITPWPDDKRYRQYNEVKLPSSNALIVYARDGSGSMDEQKCEIVSDMAWWIDVWIRRFYKRVESMYVWHDSEAIEVDQDKFYKLRMGGGTICSSAVKFIAKQFENRFPPIKWNIYVFYFTDGENWAGDNEVFIKTLKEKYPDSVVNLVGITQILAMNYEGTLKKDLDEAIKDGKLDKDVIKTTSIGTGVITFTEESRNEQVLKAIKSLLGTKKTALA